MILFVPFRFASTIQSRDGPGEGSKGLGPSGSNFFIFYLI